MPQRNTDRRRNFWLFPASYQYPRPSEPPMSLRDALRIPSSAITDESIYRQRRQLLAAFAAAPALTPAGRAAARTEERRVGKGWVNTLRFRWSPSHLKKKH